MVFKVLDRAQMSVSGTPGTGNITLGSAIAGFQTFAQAGAVTGDKFSYVAVDGSLWEYGVATYNSTGPTLTRAVTNTNAQTTSPVSLTSAATVLACLRAEDLNLAAPPLAADFSTTALGGVATMAATQAVGRSLSVFRTDTGSGTTDQSGFMGKAVPSGSSWTVTMQLKFVGSGDQYIRGGFALYSNTASKLIINHVQMSGSGQPSIQSLYCASMTAYTTAYGNTNIFIGSDIPTWWRINWNGTTYTMSYSWDGVVWFVIATFAAASFFTATHIGIGIETYDVFTAAGCVITYYSEA